MPLHRAGNSRHAKASVGHSLTNRFCRSPFIRARAHVQTLAHVLRGRSCFALRLTGEVSYVHLILQLTDQIAIPPPFTATGLPTRNATPGPNYYAKLAM